MFFERVHDSQKSNKTFSKRKKKGWWKEKIAFFGKWESSRKENIKEHYSDLLDPWD
jgi:hypothetical protein